MKSLRDSTAFASRRPCTQLRSDCRAAIDTATRKIHRAEQRRGGAREYDGSTDNLIEAEVQVCASKCWCCRAAISSN